MLRPGHQVLTGAEMNLMDDAALQEQVAYTDVFARVSPEHKLRIVEALRARNEVVAMTGDGVNDAPSIKRADIGVAMGITGTDVAKESADMVLTDDNYASIVAAVEQGRVIYSNIRKFVYYLLSCNIAEILIIFLGTLLNWGRVLTAIQLLWLNLITDGAPALALGTEKGDPDNMKRPPRPPCRADHQPVYAGGHPGPDSCHHQRNPGRLSVRTLSSSGCAGICRNHGLRDPLNLRAIPRLIPLALNVIRCSRSASFQTGI